MLFLNCLRIQAEKNVLFIGSLLAASQTLNKVAPQCPHAKTKIYYQVLDTLLCFAHILTNIILHSIIMGKLSYEEFKYLNSHI